MATVTVTGGPFTDGNGNVLPGDFQFQPVGIVDSLTDALPHEVHGTLGGWPNPYADTPPTQQYTPGCFSVVLPEGTYVFRLRTETQSVEETVVISIANGSTQTIEALISALGSNPGNPAVVILDGGGA